MRLRFDFILGTTIALGALPSCSSEDSSSSDGSGGGSSASGGSDASSGGDSSSAGASSGGADTGGNNSGGADSGGSPSAGAAGEGSGGSPEPAVPGVSVTPSGDQTTEGGGAVTLELVLEAEPTDPVVISLASSDEGEATLTPEQITFTTDNWDTPQVVTVTGQADEENDIAVDYSVTFAVASDDAAYSEYGIDSAMLTNVSFVPCASFPGTDFDDNTAGSWSGDVNFTTTFPSGADGSPYALQLEGGENQHYVGAQRDFTAMRPVYLSIWVSQVALNGGANEATTYVVLGDADVETNKGIIWFYANASSWRFLDANGAQLVGAPVLGQWEHLELFFDWDAKTSDVYFNGSLAVEDMPYRSTESESVERMNLYNYYDSTGAWDEISFGCLE